MSTNGKFFLLLVGTIIKKFFRNYHNCIYGMAQSDPIDRLMRAALSSDEEFVLALNNLLKHDLRISVRELSEKSGISQSSLYKLLHGRRSPNLSTLRAIIRALRHLYHVGDETFIGLIAARPVLESVEERVAEIDGHRMRVREYPVHTMEDAIVAAVRAEREGAIAIVCAPIVSSIIEQLVHVPVATIIPRGSVQRAIELAARKAWI
jgi:predicted transcriptional regulator